MSRPVSWAILSPAGEISKGSGFRPPPGWFSEVRACLGLALLVQGYPPVYAVRPTCSNDVDRVVYAGGADQEQQRFWGVKPEPGSEVWFFPDARMIGFGRDTNEVQRLVLAFQGKLEAERVAGGPDQRGHA